MSCVSSTPPNACLSLPHPMCRLVHTGSIAQHATHTLSLSSIDPGAVVSVGFFLHVVLFKECVTQTKCVSTRVGLCSFVEQCPLLLWWCSSVASTTTERRYPTCRKTTSQPQPHICHPSAFIQQCKTAAHITSTFHSPPSSTITPRLLISTFPHQFSLHPSHSHHTLANHHPFPDQSL